MLPAEPLLRGRRVILALMKSEGSVGGKKTQSGISQSAGESGMQRSRKNPNFNFYPFLFTESLLSQGERLSKFAERLLFMFPFIILSRMRCQMEETGGVGSGGFDVVNESTRASPPSFHQTPRFCRHPSPHYVSRVNHSQRAQLQIWMFSKMPT